MSPELQVSRFVDQLGVGATHVPDLEAVTVSLASAGATFARRIIRSLGLQQIFTARDPHSGLMQEIMQKDGGTLTDESVRDIFLQLEAGDHF